ncbi:unnamed protein product, partial [Musa hybrid cultivar]
EVLLARIKNRVNDFLLHLDIYIKWLFSNLWTEEFFFFFFFFFFFLAQSVQRLFLSHRFYQSSNLLFCLPLPSPYLHKCSITLLNSIRIEIDIKRG